MKLHIDFHQLPKTSRLYLDYLYDFDRVASFYGSRHRPFEIVSAPSICAVRTLESYPDDRRQRVVEILTRQNTALGAGADVLGNLERLKSPSCCAVVTGQQVGLFGGPLFTVFKTLAAIRLAREFQNKGLEVVPVFWINDIDHDFDEVNHCKLFRGDGELVAVHYRGLPEHQGRSVGHVMLDAEIETALQLLETHLPATGFRATLMGDLRASYRIGRSYSEAFSRTLLELFRGYGLILLDPLDTDLQVLAGPIYRRAVEDSEILNQALTTRNQELTRADYHVQIHSDPQATLLFATHERKRWAVQRFNGQFRLKGKEVSFSREQILERAARDAGFLTPNVALRPVVQDHLLPTAVYVGGPAEVAYFAQLAPLYDHFQRPMPLIFPRPSLTLVDDEVHKVADHYKMEVVDFMASDTEVLDRVFDRRIPGPIAKALSSAEGEIPAQFESLRPGLSELDPTLVQALDRAQQKVVHQLGVLRTKLLHAQEREEQDLARQVRSCWVKLFPDQDLQERGLSILMFWARYGPRLIQDLYQQIDLSTPHHRVVLLDSAATTPET